MTKAERTARANRRRAREKRALRKAAELLLNAPIRRRSMSEQEYVWRLTRGIGSTLNNNT